MTDIGFVPCLPENAPFTAEQRAYLNGFFAGLLSRGTAASRTVEIGPAPAAPSLKPLTILFGSQTGNAEALARRLAKEAGQQAFAATVFDLGQYVPAQLSKETNLLLITSTFGDGEPPGNAQAFWHFLNGAQAPPLAGLRYAVLALGDSNYPKFCQCGKDFDRRLAELGANRIAPRVDCDVEFEADFRCWADGALRALGQSAGLNQPGGAHAIEVQSHEAGQALRDAAEAQVADAPARTALFGRDNPFPAELIGNKLLNASGSAKETRHFVLELDGSSLAYEPGDALGVVPENCPGAVGELLQALGMSGDESVQASGAPDLTLREALLRKCEIGKIPLALLQAYAERTGDSTLRQVASPEANGHLAKFLWGRQIIDLILQFPFVHWSAGEWVALLKKLQPRLYSISSSPRAHPGEVHLTVSVVRYEAFGRARKGVCSTFLAERAGGIAPVFIHPNRNFRLPADPARPVIMVGPGTGVAPFRAFLEECEAAGRPGKAWLFFGDQRAATDFLYREELEGMLRRGVLARMDTAFSRDQAGKIYVQHRMLQHARELFAWLEEGAHFYVCGDASRMAKDVHEALLRVVRESGGWSAERAAAYVNDLQRQGRYQRDVY